MNLGGLSMSYFTFENKNIYYTETGRGKPLLFLHGNTASSNMYLQIAEKYMHKLLKNILVVCLLLCAGMLELHAQYDKDILQ